MKTKAILISLWTIAVFFTFSAKNNSLNPADWDSLKKDPFSHIAVYSLGIVLVVGLSWKTGKTRGNLKKTQNGKLY